MDNKKFEQQMKIYESLGTGNRVPDGAYAVITLALRDYDDLMTIFKSPYDFGYRNLMLQTLEALMLKFNGIYAETHNNEISVLLPKSYTKYDRDSIKLLSLFSSHASAVMSIQYGDVMNFVASMYILPTEDAVYDYFRWRQAHAYRSSLFTHAVSKYQSAKKISKERAELKLRHMGYNELINILKSHGVNFHKDVPLWHQRGIVMYWKIYFKTSVNPLTNKNHVVTRRKLYTDLKSPTKNAYPSFILKKALFDEVSVPQTDYLIK